MKKRVLLEVNALKTTFSTRAGPVTAVDGVSLTLNEGECLGVVGESGSGKSVTFASVMGLVRANGRIEEGEIRFMGRDLRAMSAEELRLVRGREIAMTMQDALTALNPSLRIDEQLAEMMEAHLDDLPVFGPARKRAIRDRSVEMLRLVGIPSPEARLQQYPHEFSGGMRQRIMIAIALACRPKLLIADEPTTALDVTIQAQVLDLISDLRRELGMSVVFITHDLGIVAEHCDRVMVMYAGQVVEEGETSEIIEQCRHPYTRALLASIPRPELRGQSLNPIPGNVPDLRDVTNECRFRSRCAYAVPACSRPVMMREIAPGRKTRCIRDGELA
ncbi:methionine ABC transporter ATP-binding protein [Aquamicrobium defluvii]|uniref:Methionine ABC transporter ATP-binding protein n=2 Tax=Aquamicrobium defluvii TaxID=69279 RepID=A0A011U756_9HYPH|nr:ABC transporter ATP-binding protein [Aquamicrobium defluvii]EXL01901.1 methionine ABC transporter ATP-binding protein [Aquamicrobium defluvii]EZQ12885.1 methionine ABC transporter ATP-binding protein [Halopseudomonas bauzanensis]TDR31904.1 peptide/nickel transport system ATP-binding protein/oligopeptide transport system ATP-binding protein [Aquamicrobium defluvii]